jgi:hypothetical protein
MMFHRGPDRHFPRANLVRGMIFGGAGRGKDEAVGGRQPVVPKFVIEQADGTQVWKRAREGL